MLRAACLLVLAVTTAAASGMSAWSAPSAHARADPFDGTAAQMTPGWLQVIYERNGYNYTLLDTFELNCIYGDSKKPLAYYSSKVAKLVSQELSDGAYVPVWCKYFDTLEPTKATKPDNINQFIVTFGLFPRITSDTAPYDGYDLSTPFLTSRLAFAVPRISNVLPARDTLSYSKAKQLMRSNANEYDWTFLQDGPLDKNLKSDLYGMLPKAELVNIYKHARRTSLNDFYNRVFKYDPAHKQGTSKIPVMIGELASLRYYQQYNNVCAKMKIIETFIEANTYSIGVRYPPLVVDKDIYDTFRTAVDQAILKLMRSGELELLTQQILNSESTCLEERRVVTVGAVETPPFVERQQDGSFTGLCVDILNQVENDTGIQFEYRLVDDQNTPTPKKYKQKRPSYRRRDETTQLGTEFGGSDTQTPWEKLIGEVYKGRVHMAVGPLTITPERALRVDFSIPFMTSELGAMLPSNYTDVYSLTDILERNFRVAVARPSTAFELLTTSDAPALRMLGDRIAFRTKSVTEAIDLLSSEPYVIVIDDYVSLKRQTMVGGPSLAPLTMMNKRRSSSQVQDLVNQMVVAPINRVFRDDVSTNDEDDNVDNTNDIDNGSTTSGSFNNLPQMKVVRFGLYSSSSSYAFAFPKVSGRAYANEKFTDRLRDTVSTKIEEMLRNGQIAELTDRYFENL